MKYILVFEDYEQKDAGEFFELPSDTSSKKELFNFYANKLNFPNYFGFNWDAFYDILSDLYWMDFREIVIYHQSLPQLEKEEQIIYLETLRDLVKFSDEDAKTIKFVFHSSVKEEAESLLKMKL